MANKFQKLVKYSLDYWSVYNYHSPDFNIAKSEHHRFTPLRDADFIICNMFGEIGWIEVKETSSPKFYVNSSGSNSRQWTRGLELGKQFLTFYYIINFRELDKPFWFCPEWIAEIKQFDPIQNAQYEIPYHHYQTEGAFHQKKSHKVLNLPAVMPFFQHPIKLFSQASMVDLMKAKIQVPEESSTPPTEESL